MAEEQDDPRLLTPERNPYDCSTCDSEDCHGCGTEAYLSGYEAGAEAQLDKVDKLKSRKEFLALPLEKRHELLEKQASNPEVIAYYEGLYDDETPKQDRPDREIKDLILDFIKPYIDTNVGSILVSDIESLAKELLALYSDEEEIKQQHYLQMIEQAQREERERIIKAAFDSGILCAESEDKAIEEGCHFCRLFWQAMREKK